MTFVRPALNMRTSTRPGLMTFVQDSAKKEEDRSTMQGS